MEMSAAQRGPTAAGCLSAKNGQPDDFFGQQLNQKLRMVGQLTGGRQNSWERNWGINKRSSQMGDVVKHETDT
jgi:hypothetical protein